MKAFNSIKKRRDLNYESIVGMYQLCEDKCNKFHDRHSQAQKTLEI